MIGVFSYTVILTYISLISAVAAFIFGFNGDPKMAVICLLISGLCDLFDGKIARIKKNRSAFEKDFGTQIDSLNDLVSFGVVPVAIGVGLSLSEPIYIPVYMIFVLSGLIRVAYYNTLVSTEKKPDNCFIGLPLSASVLVVPVLYLLRRIAGFAYLYPFILLVLALLFLLKIKIPKIKNYGTLIVLGIGLIEFILVLVLK